MSLEKTKQKLPQGFISPHALAGLPDNTPILVAFSGGADSGALLDMTAKYAKRCGAKLYAAHVNHGIRGAEADRDEAFCKKTADKYGIEIFTLRADVPSIAEKQQKSIETAARDVRYEYFSKLMVEHDIPILCVAHNADDNLETIIFNIARGSGLSGVCGIPQTRDCKGGIIVRPILEMSKDDIKKYCLENNIEYVTDSTNTDTDYSRNRIRALIIPELKKICPAAESAAARLSANLRADARCLDSMAACFLEENRDGFSIDTKKINDSPSAITSRAIMTLFYEISGGEDLEYPHIKAIFELSKKAISHSSLDLPAGVRAVIENGKLCFTKAPPPPKNIISEEFCVTLSEGNFFISQINAEIIFGDTKKDKNIYKKSMKLFIDSAKIVGTVTARSRMPKDKIKMNSMGKSVKKLMCDKKIPQYIRPRLPMICDDSGIIAIPMLGIKDGYHPKDTESTLCIEFNLM